MGKSRSRYIEALPIPILVHVQKGSDIITVRTFRKKGLIAELTEADKVLMISKSDAKSHLQEHAPTTSAAGVNKSKIFDGAFLGSKFKTMCFEELGFATLHLKEMKERKEWTDYSRWLFPVDEKGVPKTPYNQSYDYPETRLTFQRYMEVKRINAVVILFVPFASYDFDDVSFNFSINKDFGIVGNIEIGDKVSPQVAAKGGGFLPLVKISGPTSAASDGMVEFTVSVTDDHGTVYKDASTELFIRNSGGYLPHQVIKVKNGVGTFRLMTMGLKKGENVQVSAGFRNFKKAAIHELEITA